MLEAVTSGFADTEMVKWQPWVPIYSVSAYKNAEPGLNAALGVVLPVRPEFVSMKGVKYMWSGPGSWLVLGAADLTAARQYAAVTEQSDGRVAFAVVGPQVEAALAKLVPIDLDERIFAVGDTALTLAGHVTVQIWRETAERFVLSCFRSFANALYDALVASCFEFES